MARNPTRTPPDLDLNSKWFSWAVDTKVNYIPANGAEWLTAIAFWLACLAIGVVGGLVWTSLFG